MRTSPLTDVPFFFQCGGCGCDEEGDASTADPQAHESAYDVSQPSASTDGDIDLEETAAMLSSCCSGKPPVAAPPSNPSPAAPVVPSPAKVSSKLSTSSSIQPFKHGMHKKPAKSDHQRSLGSHEQPPPIKSLSRSSSTASKAHRPHLPKSISSGVFSNGSETTSPTTVVSPLEFPGSGFARDRSGSSASRSSFAPSPSRSGPATPNSQVPSPHILADPQTSDFNPLSDDTIRQEPSVSPGPTSRNRHNTSSSPSSSAVHHANEEFSGLQTNAAKISFPLPDPVPSPANLQMPIQFRSYEEFVAASNLHQHSLMQEQQRLREEREERQRQEFTSRGMFPLDEEMEAQLKAILAGTVPTATSTGITTAFPTFDVNAPYSNIASSSQQPSPQQLQHQSNEDFLNQPNFDFDPPSPRRGQREFSPMQFNDTLGIFTNLDDFGLGQVPEGTGGGSFDGGSNFPANAADFMLNFSAPTPAAEANEEVGEAEGADEPATGGAVEELASPDAFALEFDPVAFLENALANPEYLSFDNLTTTAETHSHEASSGSSSEGTNGGGGGLQETDPLNFDSYDPNDFDFASFAKDSPTHWLPDDLRFSSTS